MKKVLIVTYYWYPAGGSGIQRWLKFVKYLRDFNIEPIIYTIKNPNYDFTDTSLLNDIPKGITVLRQPILEPNRFLKKKESAGFLTENPSFLGKIKQYIRANYFIPDARSLWIQPSVKYLKKYLSNNTDINTIITTGPPHSMHLIALKLKKQLPNLQWIADFRDPWTDIDYFHKLPLTKNTLKKHYKLEKEVLKNADRVVVIGNSMNKKYQKTTTKVTTITNGYDTEIKEEKITLNTKFTLTHIGLMNADRNPIILWQTIRELCDEHNDFKNHFLLQLIGNVDISVKKNIKQFKLEENVKIIDYIPHSEVKKYQKASQTLLLIVNNVPNSKGIITGKIFEYLQAKRPILAIAPINGDLATIISETNSGDIVDFNSKNGLKEILFQYYTLYKQGNLQVTSKHIEKYHRKTLTKHLSEIIHSL